MELRGKTLWIVGVFFHVVLWGLFFRLAVSFLHSSEDPWYRLAREAYFWTFLKVQFSLLTYYIGIGLLFSLFSIRVLERWDRWRSASGRFEEVARYGAVFLWFWLSWISLSCVSYYASWMVPFSLLDRELGFHLTHRQLKLFSPVIYLNFLLLIMLIMAPLDFGKCARLVVSRFPARKRGAALLATVLGVGILSFIPFSDYLKRTPVKNAAARLPNIVIIGSDALRADRLGAYGYARPTSPHIDAVARQGVVLDRLYVASPSTSESLLSLLTGLTPRESGVRSIFYGPEDIRRVKEKPGIVPTLRRAGYRTVALGDWSGSDLGRLADFDFADVEPEMNFVDYIDEAARRIHLPLLAFFANPLNAWAAPNFVGLLISRHTIDSALGLAEKEIARAARTGEPLFLFVFVSTTHLPYAIPEGEPIPFGDPHYKGPHERQLNFASLDAISTADLSKELKSDSQRIKDLYDSTVWRFDRQVARIDEALKKSGLEDTVFVVLADHGEDQWDPGVGLSRTLHAGDQSIRIPFVIRAPGRFPPHRVPNLLRAVDMAPTWADLVGVPWPSSGRSFLALLEGKDEPDDRSAFIEAGISWTGPTLYPADGPHLSYPGVTSLAEPDRSIESQLLIPPEKLSLVMKAKDRVFVQGRYKVIYQPLKTGPSVTMCDLAVDSACQIPLKPDPGLAAKLKQEILKDPEDFYLAWPRETFEREFAP